LENYWKQHIPEQSTPRKHYLPIWYKETLENVKGSIGDAFIWVDMEETTDSLCCFIANLVADKLDIEVPSNPGLVCSKVLRHTNNSTVARYANDGLRE
jgi:hypothetical protein